jgi:hypothetical protein
MIAKMFHVTAEPQPRKTCSDSVAILSATAFTILLGLGCSLGFGLGGLHLMGDSWMQYNDVASSYFTMTPVRYVMNLDVCYLFVAFDLQYNIAIILHCCRLLLLEFTL